MATNYPTGRVHRPSDNYVYDVGSLSWLPEIQPATSGGSGGAVTIADGADVAEGITTDAAVITDVAGTVSGKLRGLVKWAYERMPASLGQKVMAASLPVVLASDQSAVAISAASLPLPTGAATAARQDTGNTSLASLASTVDSNLNLRIDLAAIGGLATPIAVNTGAPGNDVLRVVLSGKGAATSVNSNPVVIASDQAAIPVTAATLPLPTGAATAVNQALEVTSLASIDTKLTAPLNIAAPQGALLETLQCILLEMRVMNAQIREGFVLADEVNTRRADESLPSSTFFN
jgi:hypothetical protein